MQYAFYMGPMWYAYAYPIWIPYGSHMESIWDCHMDAIWAVGFKPHRSPYGFHMASHMDTIWAPYDIAIGERGGL